MTDVRQLDYEARREEWRQQHGLPGRKPGFGGRGDALGLSDPRLKSLVGHHERTENNSLPEAANSGTLATAPRDGVAR